RWWGARLNLDLAELALELGIPLADPGDVGFEPSSMTCDPVRVAADPRYAPKLVAAVADMMGDSETEHRMRGKAGFDAARRAWIESQLDAIERGPLLDTEQALDDL